MLDFLSGSVAVFLALGGVGSVITVFMCVYIANWYLGDSSAKSTIGKGHKKLTKNWWYCSDGELLRQRENKWLRPADKKAIEREIRNRGL
jgi:hypothetical protein